MENLKRTKLFLIMSTLLFCAFLAFGSARLYAADGTKNNQTVQNSGKSDVSAVVFAASIAFGLSALAAGFAISKVGSAAMGAVAEKPEIASQALIFIALGEGLVVFGFIIALMILGKA